MRVVLGKWGGTVDSLLMGARMSLVGLLAMALLSAALVGCSSNGGSAAFMEEGFPVEALRDCVKDASEALRIEERDAALAVRSPEEVRAALRLTEDYRNSLSHGSKGAECQKYIVLHDTEGEGDAASVVSWWDSNGQGVGAHFVVNKDGSIVQCVPMDAIAHHAGFGDAGHNAEYGVEDESRDDKIGTVPIGSWAPDYGMNSYSIGIEMVHVGGSGEYPEAQLDALDALVAYIDAYYGFESTIIDHKAWRTGNSDTSSEFAEYLANYQDHRTHS